MSHPRAPIHHRCAPIALAQLTRPTVASFLRRGRQTELARSRPRPPMHAGFTTRFSVAQSTPNDEILGKGLPMVGHTTCNPFGSKFAAPRAGARAGTPAAAVAFALSRGRRKEGKFYIKAPPVPAYYLTVHCVLQNLQIKP